MSDADEDLKALRAKRAELDAARAVKLAETPEQELARETREYKEEIALAAAQDEFGAQNVALVSSIAGAIIVKKPKKITHQYFTEQGSIKAAVLEKYVRPSLVYPSIVEYEQIIDTIPQMLVDCANACAGLAGVRKAEPDAK